MEEERTAVIPKTEEGYRGSLGKSCLEWVGWVNGIGGGTSRCVYLTISYNIHTLALVGCVVSLQC